MKKYSLTILCAFLLTIVLVLTTFAAPPRLVDDADLLTDVEEEVILARLDAISEAYQTDVVVVTVASTDGQTPMAYADDYYDYNGYGFGDTYDGILLLISMEDRDWWISTCGSCETMFPANRLDAIGEAMLDDLGMGNYIAAFDTFARECEYTINGEINGYPFPFGMNLLISLGIGFVVALIATGIMRGKLKSVRPQLQAKDYLKAGSLQVTQANEFFLYRTVNRVKKASSSSSSSGSHTSSSGRSHGGGGGKF